VVNFCDEKILYILKIKYTVTDIISYEQMIFGTVLLRQFMKVPSIMVKAKQTLTTGKPRIRIMSSQLKPTLRDSSLLMMRLKELDKEFVRQSKHLAKVTKKIGKKLTNKL